MVTCNALTITKVTKAGYIRLVESAWVIMHKVKYSLHFCDQSPWQWYLLDTVHMLSYDNARFCLIFFFWGGVPPPLLWLKEFCWMEKIMKYFIENLLYKVYNVNQLLFAATYFSDFSMVNWFMVSNVRDWAFLINIGLYSISGSRQDIFAIVGFLRTSRNFLARK
jgi:hypothetical protein